MSAKFVRHFVSLNLKYIYSENIAFNKPRSCSSYNWTSRQFLPQISLIINIIAVNAQTQNKVMIISEQYREAVSKIRKNIYRSYAQVILSFTVISDVYMSFVSNLYLLNTVLLKGFQSSPSKAVDGKFQWSGGHSKRSWA